MDAMVLLNRIKDGIVQRLTEYLSASATLSGKVEGALQQTASINAIVEDIRSVIMVCDPKARDIECRAVIRAGAHERQAQCDVHPFFKAEILHRDQALIVVLSHHDVEPALARLHIHGVARMGAAGIDALFSGRLNGGPNDPDLLISEETTFTGMRVEARNGNTRGRYAQRLAALVCKPDGGHLSGEISLLDRFAQ